MIPTNDMAIYPEREKVIEMLRERHIKDDGSLQTRRHGGPYFMHPIAVTEILHNRFNETRRNVLIASDCHDLLEDTQTTYQELYGWYGEEVANIVKALTKPPKVRQDGFYSIVIDGVEYNSEKTHYEEIAFAYYKTLRKSTPGAIEIKVCDRIHNLSEMQFTDKRFQRRYLTDTMLLVTAIDGVAPEQYLNALKYEFWNAANNYVI